MFQTAREYEYTRADFERIRALIHRHAGIILGEGRSQLVYTRLSRRLRALELRRFADYIELLAPGGAEWQQFTNSLTTNLTAFFREQHHFPVLARHARGLRRRPLHVWSAATSTGEEAYSIAIALADAFGRVDPPVRILATDLDTDVLETARRGIYPLQRLELLEPRLRRRYFRRGSGRHAGFGRVIPELQRLITFRQLNLLDATWPLSQRFDAIFCRNVMIYFDKPTQARLLEKFVQALQPDGLFFAGHAESFAHARAVVEPLGRTVYRAAAPPRDAEPHALPSSRGAATPAKTSHRFSTGDRQ